MKRQIIILLGIFYGGISFAQRGHKYAEGNTFYHYGLEGDTADFIFINYGIKSQSWVEGKTFHLGGKHQEPVKREWRFGLTLSFNPSGSNYVEVFLVADSLPLKAKNGWYVRIGNTRDEISLYEMKEGVSEERISGLDGVLNKSSNEIEVRVRCLQTGEWKLERKTLEEDWIAEGVYESAGSNWDSFMWFGLKVRQSTSSFFGKHILSYLYIGDTLAEIPEKKFRTPKNGDIIITEVMSKPKQRAAWPFPESEYVEIKNISEDTLSLNGCSFSDPTSTGIISNQIIAPGAYAVLVKSITNWPQTYPVIKVEGMPSLNDAGDDLVLRNNSNEGICFLRYREGWYGSLKSHREGISLLRVSEAVEDFEEGNWIAHRSVLGGSPGKGDTFHPFTIRKEIPVIRGAVDGLGRWVFTADGIIDSMGLTKTQWKRETGEKIPMQAYELEQMAVSVQALNWEKGKGYWIEGDTVKFKGGKTIINPKLFCGIGLEPQYGWLRWNEVMFESHEGEAEYVEILNETQEFISLERCRVELWRDGIQEGVYSLRGIGSIAPGGYLCLTADTAALGRKFGSVHKRQWYQWEEMPDLYSEYATLVLSTEDGTLIDSLSYSRKWHSAWLVSTKGISLERTCSKCGTAEWISASGLSWGGTPGAENTQWGHGQKVTRDIKLSEEWFTPDGDGERDYLSLFYHFINPGVRMSVYIFNEEGIWVGKAIENAITGITGEWNWDGSVEGRILDKGNYIMVVESIGENNKTGRARFVVSLL